ncbi:MAG: M48 family metallopeptidase [Zoogloeaceae bacterium]|nr:M48 family metallopeptidase [Zoogloeaceae bacterium]
MPESEQRVIELDGRAVPYELRRSARRTLGMRLDASGLRVSVPWLASTREAERFVVQHRGWLAKRLVEREAALGAQTFQACDGARFPLFGTDCVLRIGEPGARSKWLIEEGNEALLVGARDPAAAVVSALRKRALPDYASRVAEHCRRLGVAVPPVRLTSARTRWGSCSARSGIRLHWRLVHLPPELIDYVVAHEVAHLLEMNHSPRFWAHVQALHPDWQASRRQLHALARLLPIIQPGSGNAPHAED